MDASNEAPFGVGLDEFIEFTKGEIFFLLSRANSFTQTKVGREAERLRNFKLIFSLAVSLHSEVVSLLCFRIKPIEQPNWNIKRIITSNNYRCFTPPGKKYGSRTHVS